MILKYKLGTTVIGAVHTGLSLYSSYQDQNSLDKWLKIIL